MYSRIHCALPSEPLAKDPHPVDVPLTPTCKYILFFWAPAGISTDPDLYFFDVVPDFNV